MLEKQEQLNPLGHLSHHAIELDSPNSCIDSLNRVQGAATITWMHEDGVIVKLSGVFKDDALVSCLKITQKNQDKCSERTGTFNAQNQLIQGEYRTVFSGGEETIKRGFFTDEKMSGPCEVESKRQEVQGQEVLVTHRQLKATFASEKIADGPFQDHLTLRSSENCTSIHETGEVKVDANQVPRIEGQQAMEFFSNGTIFQKSAFTGNGIIHAGGCDVLWQSGTFTKVFFKPLWEKFVELGNFKGAELHHLSLEEPGVREKWILRNGVEVLSFRQCGIFNHGCFLEGVVLNSYPEDNFQEFFKGKVAYQVKNQENASEVIFDDPEGLLVLCHEAQNKQVQIYDGVVAHEPCSKSPYFSSFHEGYLSSLSLCSEHDAEKKSYQLTRHPTGHFSFYTAHSDGMQRCNDPAVLPSEIERFHKIEQFLVDIKLAKPFVPTPTLKQRKEMANQLAVKQEEERLKHLGELLALEADEKKSKMIKGKQKIAQQQQKNLEDAEDSARRDLKGLEKSMFKALIELFDKGSKKIKKNALHRNAKRKQAHIPDEEAPASSELLSVSTRMEEGAKESPSDAHPGAQDDKPSEQAKGSLTVSSLTVVMQSLESDPILEALQRQLEALMKTPPPERQVADPVCFPPPFQLTKPQLSLAPLSVDYYQPTPK